MSKTRRQKNYDSACSVYSFIARGVYRDFDLHDAIKRWPEIFEYADQDNVRLTDAARGGDWFSPECFKKWPEGTYAGCLNFEPYTGRGK